MMGRRPRISFVVAMDENRLIGADGVLPWRLPDDMKRFRELTWGHPVLMGRKTYESIPERFRPLPGRQSIVLTRQERYEAPSCQVVGSLPEAMALVEDGEELMVIGGAQLYEQLLPYADRLYLTLVHGEHEGDAYFPALDLDEWREVSREPHAADGRHALPFTFIVLERTPPPANETDL